VWHLFTSYNGGGICFGPRARVRLCVCLCARLLKNACMDLDEMLRVDRCRDMDKLINFWARSGSQSGCWNRIAFSHSVCSYSLQRGILLVGKIGNGRPSNQRRVVLRRRNTVVGSKYALPSALIVQYVYSGGEQYSSVRSRKCKKSRSCVKWTVNRWNHCW